MAAKRKRNAPETIIMRAVNPAEPPKRSRAEIQADIDGWLETAAEHRANIALVKREVAADTWDWSRQSPYEVIAELESEAWHASEYAKHLEESLPGKVENPKRSRAANPRSRAANPPREIEAQIARAERLSAKGRRLLDYDPRDLSKAEQRKRHADADKVAAEIYEIVHDLEAAGYREEARALTGNPRASNPRATRTFFLWLDTSGDESGVGEHIDGHFAPLSGAKTAAKRLAKKTGNDVVIYEVGDGHSVARVYPSGKIDDFESNPRVGNPRAKAATSTTAANAGIAVDYFLAHHKVPTGKFGPWGLLEADEGSPSRTPKYAYGVGRVPTQVIEELDRQGIVFGSEDADTVLGDELVLTIINEGSLYPQYQTIAKNMAKMMASGKYDPSKAVIGWRHWVDRGAKEYRKEYPEVEFDVPTRDYAARRVAREFEVEHKVQSGNPRKVKSGKVKYTGVLANDIPALMLEILVDSTVQEVEHYTHTEISESKKDEIEELLVEKAKAVYGGPTGRELAKKSPEAVRDQIRVYMEHWLAAYLKKNDPALLRKLPPGYGWSYSFYLDKSRRRNPTRKANCECQHQNARAKRLRKMDEY